MLLAYVDESGDIGDPARGGSSACYALGCVLVDLDKWSQAFEDMVNLRRRVRDHFGVLMQDELKANYLIRGSGPLRRHNLSPDQRRLIYRAHLRQLPISETRAFAVVTDKAATGFQGVQCFDESWNMLLQRLERTSNFENQQIMIIHDEGDNDRVRRHVRKARRFLTAGKKYGSGGFQMKMTHLIEDPVPRSSQHSYLIQVADLVAYAAWRSYMPPGPGAARVVPSSTWGQMGSAAHAAVNKLSGGVPGVVVRK
ncbi:DUF3800 domain-containing protein [Solicola sp. PLA-1-18]|uniref:DUF3800 domain-containing protein n=1 Tax=Solicola sp. PLA-1-18 TaxID=3380532 RepID=UPI003B7D75DD